MPRTDPVTVSAIHIAGTIWRILHTRDELRANGKAWPFIIDELEQTVTVSSGGSPKKAAARTTAAIAFLVGRDASPAHLAADTAA